jgi:signal transduction histidine kinase
MTGEQRAGGPPRPATRLMLWMRLALLALVVGLAIAAQPRQATLAWCGLLAVAALPGLIAPDHPVIGRLGRIAEVLVVGLSTAALATAYGSTLPYLIVPVRAAAVFVGSAEALAMAGLGVVTVVGAGAAAGRLTSGDYLLPAVLWLLVAVAGGLAGRRMYPAERTAEPQPYAAATRLLTQLRTVARQLPGGTLDPGGIAAGLLDEVGTVAPADRAAVLGRSGGGRLVVLAQRGPDRFDWETSLSADTPIAEAWVSQQPHAVSRSLSRSAPSSGRPISALVVPLVAGVRSIGLLVVEADRSGAYPLGVVTRIRGLVSSAALRLEAALLFDEVRTLATTEERQRLAREIHDGIAQELVMVGYGIDNAVGQLEDVPGAGTAVEDLHTLRAEVTRLITELRLSLFELRTDVDPSGGLATALANYARTVGASGGMRVHLSLDESTARLPASVETELLRIGQEAITNARKHAHAENLWVTCEIDPPFGRIEVADDGLGMPDMTRDDSYGLSIMAERARRVRADLRISPRTPNGTTVAVALGARPRRGSVSEVKGMEGDNARQRDG